MNDQESSGQPLTAELAATTPAPQPRKKLGSSRRALWLARRRSRSLDSSEVFCDYTSLKRSSKIRPRSSFVETNLTEVNDASDEGIYEEALRVEFIRGVSLVDEEQMRENSLGRNCVSLGNVDSDTVLLQDPSLPDTTKYENVRLRDSTISNAYDQGGVYDEPWHTVDALQMLLKEDTLDLTEEEQTTLLRGGKKIQFTESDSESENYDVSTVRRGPAFCVDPKLPLLQQSWYHDELSRMEAEHILRTKPVGAFLVRINSLQRKDLTLSVRTVNGVVHIIAVRQIDCRYILGQFSEPFESAAAMISHYNEHPLKINGADHTLLTLPVHCDIT